MKYRMLCLIAAVLSIAPAHANERPGSVKLCFGENYFYPWHQENGDGLNFVLLDRVAARLGIKFSYVALPWKRCLRNMLFGEVDGVFAASFKPDRLEAGVYPAMANGKPDAGKRLMMEGYHLFKLKGSTLDWDGKQFHHLRGPIATPLGYAIVDQLKASGVNVDEVPGETEAVFEKVVRGRAQAVAMNTQVGEKIIQMDQFRGKFEKVPTSLVENPYYLMLSHQLHDAHPGLASEIWEAITTVRESVEYKQIEIDLLAQPCRVGQMTRTDRCQAWPR